MAVVVSAMTKEKIYTEASAFSIGVLNGIIGRSRPTAALLTTVVTAAGGLFGSLMTTGRMADIMEGVASGSLGALGYSIPFWINAPEEATSRGATASGIRRIREIQAPPKALKEAPATSVRRSPAPAYASEFENVEVY